MSQCRTTFPKSRVEGERMPDFVTATRVTRRSGDAGPAVSGPGPVWVDLRASNVGDRMTEQTRVWDSKRRLVGESSQPAAVRVTVAPPPGRG